MFYKGWDVHSYTTNIQQCLSKYPQLFQYKLVPKALRDLIVKEMKEKLKHPKVVMALDKMVQRGKCYSDGCTYVDNQIQALNIYYLLLVCWRIALIYREEALLKEMLIDAGNTCIQGDSHRLYMFFWGAVESNPAILNNYHVFVIHPQAT